MRNSYRRFEDCFQESEDLVKPEVREEWKSYLERCEQLPLGIDRACELTVISASVDVMKGLSDGVDVRIAEHIIHNRNMGSHMAKNTAQSVYYLHPRGEEFKNYWCRQEI